MSTIRPVQWGFAGTGSISGSMASQIANSAISKAAAVSSRSLESAKAFAATHGIGKAYDSLDDMLADPDIEAIYIALPHALHKGAILAALNAGKHVLCEKPMALNAGEVAEIAAHPRAKSLMITEGFMVRYQPQWEWIRAQIADGALGTVKQVTAFTALQLPPPAVDPARGTLAGDRSLLLDIGCYSVHLVRTIFNADPLRVSALIERDPVTGLETFIKASLDFGGRYADVIVSNVLRRGRRIHVLGSAGSLEIMTPIHTPPTGAKVLAALVGDGNADPVEQVFPSVEQYGLQMDDVSRHIRAGDQPRVTLANALRNARTLDAIVASAEAKGAWAEL
ncbi:Gfo/Idh/MocA family protein [Devosia sp. Root685]|uniref:Gfo/Idh/MocA family protein n=1 Tax=Devosia sp. Root685 TaxID=1736587 RepID=UPI000AAFE105|nr:Gfo/Idh/MocA family oxidoreductase [Devosia sp. Root685]